MIGFFRKEWWVIPKRHGSSHGLATLVSMLAAALLTTFVRSRFEAVMGYFDQFSKFLLNTLELSTLEFTLTKETMSTILFASVMSLVWGIGFYFGHRD